MFRHINSIYYRCNYILPPPNIDYNDSKIIHFVILFNKYFFKLNDNVNSSYYTAAYP